MNKLLFLILFAFLSSLVHAQPEAGKKQAYEDAIRAIQLMDNGEIDKSIEILEQCAQLDPNNYLFPYEMGYAYYLKGDYSNCIKQAKIACKLEGANDQCYQMMGNAYDLKGRPRKAIKTYMKGLEEFPYSGKLYLELGNMHQDKLGKALEYYETGILVEPSFPSNYYWASRIFCNSNQEIWGLMYGELFMNIERGTERTAEISELLYNTYSQGITITSDTSYSISLCENMMFNEDDNTKFPFCMIYETMMLLAMTDIEEVDLAGLNKIRTNFVETYFEKDFRNQNPDLLFGWHQDLIDKGYFEAYNYWLLGQGNPEEIELWLESNENQFNEFVEWFSENPLIVDEKHVFHRLLF